MHHRHRWERGGTTAVAGTTEPRRVDVAASGQTAEVEHASTPHPYDRMSDEEQTAQRARWDREIETKLAALDLTAEFEAQGQSDVEWVDGEVVHHRPTTAGGEPPTA